MAGLAKLEITGNEAVVVVSGNWKVYERNTQVEEVLQEVFSRKQVKYLRITADGLEYWDSSLVNFIKKALALCTTPKITVDLDGTPDGVKRLVALASSQVVHSDSREQSCKRSLMEICGAFGFQMYFFLKSFSSFVGDLSLSFGKFFRGKTRIRSREFGTVLQDVGARALPIVALISFLVGLIISFISILQLEQFGASIYVADLVGIAMMREMGCIMTGVIMSGRTGAAFAATIGTMVVNDEIDALRTTGISVIDFIVLPRILALALMMPILCVFADFIGIAGGICSSLLMTDLTISLYCTETASSVLMSDFFIGVFKSVFFGLLIAAIGCQKGMRCGKSAEDVGLATTSAVVTSITAIIIADAIFAIIFSALGI